MAWDSILLLTIAFVGVEASGDLSDFSNDLATDLGPLLVLFGDSMTKQYLSESTSFLDYIIFATAPIGIITAIVSTIRVCGHSSLRAFIGRSQEGDGAIEAELCTSTSRDVCELFNRGGIMRVLGKPSILELVYTPRQGGLENANSSRGIMNKELNLSSHYFKRRLNFNDDDPDWERVEDSDFGLRSSRTYKSFESLAPNPNLSLNVGIVKRSKWVFLLIAIVGVILQTGVVALAGVGVWILGWNLNEGGNPSSRDYAPIMFITGTILMCGGMWSCACLIGQTTKEVCFRRKSRHLEKETAPRLFWLQPGPQRIGDQSFDAFAYCEDIAQDPLQVWMSSRKDLNEKFELYTCFAVGAVLIGYFMQFIGLRGMKAWISLAQLGITIVMSILRGCLRMQRLGRNANKLAKYPDMVSGHELDWLSFEIVAQKTHSRSHSQWYITGQPGQAAENLTQQTSAGETLHSEQSSAKPATNDDDPADCMELLRTRWRLAYLTGHSFLEYGRFDEYVRWDNEFVKVRVKASQVSQAICQSVAQLFPKTTQPEIMLRVQAAVLNVQNASRSSKQSIDIALSPPDLSSLASWRTDSSKIEAILGLWMWTMVADDRITNMAELADVQPTWAESVQSARIVLAGPDDHTWGNNCKNMQGEMNLWLGLNPVGFLHGALNIGKYDQHGLAALFQDEHRFEKEYKGDPNFLPAPNSASNAFQERIAGVLQRFCGWIPVHRMLEDMHSEEHVKLRVQYAKVARSPQSMRLLDLCSQELFSSLIASLAGLLKVDETTISESSGIIQLENPVVNTFASAFVESGLGSRSDALLCIIPALRHRVPSPDPEKMLTALTKAADTYRQNSEWERAETVLRWACERFSSLHGGQGDSSHLFVEALRVTGELYRWSLNEDLKGAKREFGKSGIDWMVKRYCAASNSIPETKDILDCYQLIRDYHDTNRAPNGLVEAIKIRDRTQTLYSLCFLSTGAFGSEDLQPALPLAVRNDWKEVASAILEMKANPNSRDQDGRTAISYCAELNLESYVKPLIERGASVDLSENCGSPLIQAVQNEHMNIAELLLGTGYVDVNRVDKGGRTALSWASEQGSEAFVQYLLRKDASVNLMDTSDRPALAYAAENGHESIVQLLLKKGASPDKRALSGAAGRGHESIVRLLLEKSDDPDPEALSEAAERGHESIVRLLLEKSDGPGPLTLAKAAGRGHESIVQLLLDKGADPAPSALTEAAGNGHESIVRLLFEKGADLDELALARAVQSGHRSIVEWLLENGADPDNFYALRQAGSRGDESMVRLLLERGANPDEFLSQADKEGHEDIAQALLKKLKGFVWY